MSVCATCGERLYRHDFIGMFCPICTYRSIEKSFEISAGLSGGSNERKHMHYKNGRAARLGDQVVYKGWDQQVRAGVVTTASASSTTSNLTVAPALGGNTDCLTASEAYHVEDAWGAVEAWDSPPSPAAAANVEVLPQAAAASFEPSAEVASPAP